MTLHRDRVGVAGTPSRAAAARTSRIKDGCNGSSVYQTLGIIIAVIKKTKAAARAHSPAAKKRSALAVTDIMAAVLVRYGVENGPR